MKFRHLTLILSSFLVVAVSCKKDKPADNIPESLDLQKITLTTVAAVFRSDNSIKTGGLASIDLSKYSNLEYGVCFGHDPNPLHTDKAITVYSSSNNKFDAVIGSQHISLEKPLYIRAFVRNSNGIVKYGNQVTVEKKYDLRIELIKDISVEKFTIDFFIGSDLSEAKKIGFCFSSSPNPTLNNLFKNNLTVSTGKLSLSSENYNYNQQEERLNPGKTYYVRVFAETDIGVAYSEQKSFRLAGYMGESGGVVVFDKGQTSDGWRYLEASREELTTSSYDNFVWNCNANANVHVNTSTDIGSGEANSTLMKSNCNYTNNAGAMAFYLVQNGKSDWFLPSLEELKLVFDAYMKRLIDMGLGRAYWSSSQASNSTAYEVESYQSMSSTFYRVDVVSKGNYRYVWPVRKY